MPGECDEDHLLRWAEGPVPSPEHGADAHITAPLLGLTPPAPGERLPARGYPGVEALGVHPDLAT